MSPEISATSEPASVAALPAAKSAAPAVIRIIQGAEETSHERLLKKHLPAWVVSGAFHVIILVVMILIGMGGKGETKASDEIVNVVVDKPDAEEKKIDLTNPDLGLDSELAAAIENNRQEDLNIDAPVVSNEPIGINTELNTVADTPAPAGLGAGTDFGLAGDDGAFKAGTGGAGGVGAAGLRGRSGATRDKMAKAGGGNSASEAAVAKGLIWLDRTQNKSNGAWLYEGSHKGDVVAATGMGLLPFLAAGQTHNGADKDNKYKDTVRKGLDFILSQQLPTGTFRTSSGMYAHAIAAVVLCEAYGMTNDKSKLLLPARRAIEYIMKAQAGDGSWGYAAGQAGDTSIVGWQIQALQSARMCKDIPVDPRVLERARKFLDKVADGSKKSKYGYRDNEKTTPVLSAVGLLCRYYADGWGPVHPGIIDGVENLRKQWMPTEARFDMYYYYYATQIMHFHEGDVWHKEWNPKMRDLLVKLQVGGKGVKVDGSWDPDRSLVGSSCGRHGTTCLALLTLEVYYRHLPLYKRDTAGLKDLERGK